MACPLDIVSVKPGTPHSMLALPSLSLVKRALQLVTRCTAGLLLSRLHLHGRLRCSYVTKAAPVLATPSSLSLSIKVLPAAQHLVQVSCRCYCLTDVPHEGQQIECKVAGDVVDCTP